MNYMKHSNELLNTTDAENLTPPKRPHVNESFSNEKQKNNKNSISFSHKKTNSLQVISNSFLNILISPQKKPLIDHKLDIGVGETSNYYQNDEENSNLHNSYLNNTNEMYFLKSEIEKLPYINKLKMQSMVEIMQAKSQSVQINEKKNHVFLQTLEEKTKEIEDILNKQANYKLHTMKLTLSIVLSLLDNLKNHPNLEISKLQAERSRFFNFSKEFEIKCRNFPESSSIMIFFEKIIKLLENYMSGHKTDDIILRVGSQEELKNLEINEKPNYSNPFIESPEGLEWRTRIMKSEKYGKLKVQTKNLEEFRYIGKKQNVQNVNNLLEAKIIIFCRENFEIIIGSICAFMIAVILIIMLLSYFT